jgi:leader peptidase (prepilin peptidase)/N-methyltransferase
MIEAAVAFLFGLLIGSFMNVCIYRWPRDLSVVRPRSHCASCEKTIAWYDNVPLLSYVILGGRCRHCGSRIPARYPIVEFATAACFFYFVWKLGPTLSAVKMCVFSAIMIGLFFTDLEERILPDELTLGGALAGIVFAAFVAMPSLLVELLWLAGVTITNQRVASLTESAAAGGLSAGMLWLLGWAYLKIRHKEGVGLGDVKLMLVIGAFLGLGGVLQTMLIGAVGGSVIGGAYIWLAGKERDYYLPFGTFLAAAALGVAILSHQPF